MLPQWLHTVQYVIFWPSLGWGRSGRSMWVERRSFSCVDVNASSILFVTWPAHTLTVLHTHTDSPVLVEQPISLLNAFAYCFSAFVSLQLPHCLSFFHLFFTLFPPQLLHCFFRIHLLLFQYLHCIILIFLSTHHTVLNSTSLSPLFPSSFIPIKALN